MKTSTTSSTVTVLLSILVIVLVWVPASAVASNNEDPVDPGAPVRLGSRFDASEGPMELKDVSPVRRKMNRGIDHPKPSGGSTTTTAAAAAAASEQQDVDRTSRELKKSGKPRRVNKKHTSPTTAPVAPTPAPVVPATP